jgi:hypothetical protein
VILSSLKRYVITSIRTGVTSVGFTYKQYMPVYELFLYQISNAWLRFSNCSHQTLKCSQFSQELHIIASLHLQILHPVVHLTADHYMI